MRVLTSLSLNKKTESSYFARLWMKVWKGMASSRQDLWDFSYFFFIFINLVRKSLEVVEACAITHLESFSGDTRSSSNFFTCKECQSHLQTICAVQRPAKAPCRLMDLIPSPRPLQEGATTRTQCAIQELRKDRRVAWRMSASPPVSETPCHKCWRVMTGRWYPCPL